MEDLADASLWELLINPDVEAAVARAKSASDASLLRRKGHLKEQDKWIEYIRTMHETHTVEEVMAKMERWIAVRGVCLCWCCQGAGGKRAGVGWAWGQDAPVGSSARTGEAREPCPARARPSGGLL